MIGQNCRHNFNFSIDKLTMPGFSEWLFCPGMLFQATAKWWGNKGLRERRHEGLDLLFYRDEEERIRHIDNTFQFPVMSDGVVVGIIGDFLGKSIIVEHTPLIDDSHNTLTIYGHTAPCDNIHVGLALRKGDIIASIAEPKRASTSITPHLHISVASTHTSISYDRLNWDIIGASEMLTLLDPLDFIGCSYRIVGDDNRACRALPIRN